MIPSCLSPQFYKIHSSHCFYAMGTSIELQSSILAIIALINKSTHFYLTTKHFFFCLQLTNEIQKECVKCVQTVETLQKKLKLKSFLEGVLSSAFPGTLVYHTSHKHVHVSTCIQSLVIHCTLSLNKIY